VKNDVQIYTPEKHLSNRIFQFNIDKNYSKKINLLELTNKGIQNTFESLFKSAIKI